MANATTEPDVPPVAAALLHDCIEDAGVTKQKISDRFGGEIAAAVAEVSDDESLKLE